ncbi:NACHT domain-containing protein [Herpetosiphon llansteffanensis]|uniref:NACHT domain-containing protein n=1 Tax=Herpetosiphon llansteffanensis TaxID=2094568 RepID=UPI000D7CD81C|nr:SUMF1/EgtB/PvdO family nonheme iron enzyme [Herpetosiphon llansteffanensis]
MTDALAAQRAAIEQVRAIIGDIAADAALAALGPVLTEPPPVSMAVTASQESQITDVTMINAHNYHAAPPDPSMTAAEQALSHYVQRLAGDCSTIPLGRLDATDAASDQGIGLAQVYIALHVQNQNSESHGHSISAIKAINQTHVTMLLGAPGAGKSTVVNYLCERLAHAWLVPDAPVLTTTLSDWTQGRRVPVRLILREWAAFVDQRPAANDPLGDLKDYLADQCARWQCTAALSLLWAMLHNGQAVLIADGLDEVVGTPLPRLMQSLTKARTTWQTTRIVITCRVLDYQEEPQRQLAGAQVKTLAPLTDDQIQQFVTAWYSEYVLQRGMFPDEQNARAQRLQQAIITRVELGRLATSPLLLTIMAIVHAGRGFLPESEALLYKECLEILLVRWRQTDATRVDLLDRLEIPGFGRKQLFDALARLGFLAHDQVQRDTTSDAPADLRQYDVLVSLAESLSAYVRNEEDQHKAALTILYALKRGNGVLLQRGPQIFAFPHRTFQEFLAGYHLAGLVNKKPLVYERASQIHWHNALRLMVSYRVLEANDLDFPEEAIRGLIQKSDSLSQILAGELLTIVGHGPLVQYYGDTLHKATALWQRITQMMCHLATTRDDSQVPVAQRVRAGLAHGILAFGKTVNLTVKEPLFLEIDRRLPLAYLNTQMELDAWWQEALDEYWCECSAGAFWMGDETENAPLTQEMLNYDFAIGRYPVTNAEYARFIAAGGYTTEQWWTPHGLAFLQPGGHPWDDQAQWITLPRMWDDSRYNAPTQPVVGISWYEAIAYCAWASEQLGYKVRLPTSLEWERAARHTDKRRYPWGNEFPKPNYINYKDTMIGLPTPIGCFSLGDAEGFISDLVGNVSEWLATSYATPLKMSEQPECDPHQGILLSYSNFYTEADLLSCGSRKGYLPNGRDLNFGFRMVALGAS